MINSFTKTRLAPSPTGALHLGHARTFLITWWLAQRAGAEVVLRMEDLDAGRAKLEAVTQAYEDLRWLGMDWDVGPEDSDDYVQSQRTELYDWALEELWAKGAVYPCVCRRAEIAAAVAASVGAPQEGDAAYRYEGMCREKVRVEWRGLAVREVEARVQGESGRRPCWRLKVPDAEIGFVDALAGPQQCNVWRDAGDFPVTKFDGGVAYQLACVVDDHAMGIDCVIRGNDLLSSTPRQMLLYRVFGWEPPRFAHVPLVVGSDGKRLAKRHGESRIAQYRRQGVSAEKVVGWVAWRSGQIECPREMSAWEAGKMFQPEKVPKEKVVLGEADRAWLGM